MQAVVFGNAALDVICQTVDEVPRYDSIGFERAVVAPGGCASNVAVGLRALGVNTALVACLGDDPAADLMERYWDKLGLDHSRVRREPGLTTAVSIGLIDQQAQPRFLHSPGVNALLTVDDLDLSALAAQEARVLHVAGFFVLPGLVDGRLPGALALARRLGMQTSLDVVRSPHMENAAPLWPCLPELDLFLCNSFEASFLAGEEKPDRAAQALRARGARTVIVKLGEDGCWLESSGLSLHVPTSPVKVVDTTGAGDAFAAGLLEARLNGADWPAACRAANAAGAHVVSALGAVSGWFTNNE